MRGVAEVVSTRATVRHFTSVVAVIKGGESANMTWGKCDDNVGVDRFR